MAKQKPSVHQQDLFAKVPFALIEDERCGKNEILVYAALSYHAGFVDRRAFPSITTICKRSRLARATAIKALQVLEETGFVVTERKSGDVNKYLLMAMGSSVSELGVVQPLNGGSSATEPERDTVTENHSNEKPSAIADVVNGKVESKETSLYHDFEKAFLTVNDEADWNYPMQGRHIKALVRKCMGRAAPEEHARSLLETFWRLRKSNDKFWSGQPFNASTLNADGIYSRVLTAMEKQDDMSDVYAYIDKVLR